MRNFFMFLLLTLLICGSFGIAGAVPMYYTFQGEITLVENTNGSIDDDAVYDGLLIERVLIIDVDARGYDTMGNGTRQYYDDKIDQYGIWDYFYVDYVSGLNLAPPVPGYTSVTNDGYVTESNRGYIFAPDNGNDPWTVIGGGGSSNANIWLTAASGTISTWNVGQDDFKIYQSLRTILDDELAIDRWWADLELVSIETVTPGNNPVPEPATMLLFGLGLLGLAGVNRKKIVA